MSREEEPAKVPEAQGDSVEPLAIILDRLDRMNVTLFQLENRIQNVEKSTPFLVDSKEADSRRDSLDAPIISHKS